MYRTNLWLIAFIMLLYSCNKTSEQLLQKPPEAIAATTPDGFTKFIIKKGQHYTEGSIYKTIETSELNFVVKFDSTAIYKSIDPENQYDINKLYGFSDNDGNHHQFSARIGWRWSDGALRLFAYIYNNGTRSSKELKAIPIGAEVKCSIQAKGSEYIFIVDGVAEKLPRKAASAKAKGYQLYPYFGGNEVAPHDVNVYIKAS